MQNSMTLEEIKKDKWLSKVMCKGFENIFYNYYTNSSEAFFGMESPLPSCLKKYVEKIRDLYEMTGIGGAKEPVKDRKAAYKRFKSTIQNMEAELAKIMNVEDFTVGLMEDVNAFAVPMCWDRNLVTRINKKKTFNNELKVSLEDIVEEKDGFRFKDKTGKQMIICLGLGLYNEGLSDDEIVAVLLHEMGHCLQQMLVGINGNVINDARKQAINVLYICLTPLQIVLAGLFKIDIVTIIFGVLALLFSFFAWLHERTINHNIKKLGEEEAGKRFILEHFDSDEFDRNKMADWVKDLRLDTIKAVIKSPTQGIGTKIMAGISYAILSLVMVLYATILPVLTITNIIGHFTLLGYRKFLKKERRYEQFADMFTTMYGYGQYQGSALAKIADNQGVDLKAFNFLYYIPGINLYYSFGTMVESQTNLLLAGYPDTRERIEGLYSACEFELKNNDKLSKSAKAEIKAQMDDIKETYDKYVYGLRGPNFVWGLFNRLNKGLCGKTLENHRTDDMVENVMIPLYELKKEYRKEAEKANPAVFKNNEVKLSIIDKLSLFYANKLDTSWITGLKESLGLIQGLATKGLESYNLYDRTDMDTLDLFTDACEDYINKIK